MRITLADGPNLPVGTELFQSHYGFAPISLSGLGYVGSLASARTLGRRRD
jgi:hypothetical protein